MLLRQRFRFLAVRITETPAIVFPGQLRPQNQSWADTAAVTVAATAAAMATALPDPAAADNDGLDLVATGTSATSATIPTATSRTPVRSTSQDIN